MPTAKTMLNMTIMLSVKPRKNRPTKAIKKEIGIAIPTINPGRNPNAATTTIMTKKTAVNTDACNRPSLLGRHDPVTDVHPEIDLSGEEMGKSVSRRHAKIEYRDGQFFLTEEIGTLNTTAVNGVKLETGVMTPLIDGDEIGLGAVKLIFRENIG